MFIQTEETPNPQVLKFIPGKTVMRDDTLDVPNLAIAPHSPLAQALFQIEGVKSLFFGSDFISVTKNNEIDWMPLKPLLLAAIMEHYMHFDNAMGAANYLNPEAAGTSENDPVVLQIREIIETRVRPAVAQDGGDIIFDNFIDGIVYVKLQGACAGCPSSTETLKAGIENMLRHYIPEVQMVQAI